MKKAKSSPNPGWTRKDPNDPYGLTASQEYLSFKQFDKTLGGTRAHPHNCERQRREMIFGSLGWKFDFSKARGVLTMNRGGRPRKLYENS